MGLFSVALVVITDGGEEPKMHVEDISVLANNSGDALAKAVLIVTKRGHGVECDIPASIIEHINNMRQFSVSLVIITNEHNHTNRHVETLKVSANSPAEALALADEICTARNQIIDTAITASIEEII